MQSGLTFNIHQNVQNCEAQSACAASTHKGVNKHSKDVIQTQQQRPELPAVTLLACE